MTRCLIYGTICAVSAGFFAGCGYSSQSSLDPQYQTIAISPFYDETREYDLECC